MTSCRRVYPEVQAVYTGQDILIRCYSNKEVYWTRDGFRITWNQGNGSDLYYRNAKPGLTGQYVCHGKKKKGFRYVSFKKSAWVYVGDEDNSRIEPQYQEVPYPTNVSINCLTNNPVWFNNSLWNVVKNYNKTSLRLQLDRPEKGGIYFCYGKFGNREFIAKSIIQVYQKVPGGIKFYYKKHEDAYVWSPHKGPVPNQLPKEFSQLYIHEDGGDIENIRVSVTACQRVFPRVQAVYTGRNIYIRCYSDKEAYWYRRGFLVSIGQGSANGLYLRNADQSLTGQYVCHGKKKVGFRYVRFKKSAWVYVGDEDNSSMIEPYYQEVPYPTNITLECRSGWYNTVWFNNSLWNVFNKSIGPYLQFQLNTPEQGGIYFCYGRYYDDIRDNIFFIAKSIIQVYKIIPGNIKLYAKHQGLHLPPKDLSQLFIHEDGDDINEIRVSGNILLESLKSMNYFTVVLSYTLFL